MGYSNYVKALLVLQFIVLEVTDFIFDWDFYIELNNSERYYKTTLTLCVLIVAILGTLNFAFASVCLVYSVKTRKRHRLEDFLDCITTWFEDVPQMVIAVIVAIDVREPITNWVQYTKAGLAIFEAVLRCAIIFVTCCCQNRKFEDVDSKAKCPKVANGINFVGYALILICAVVILVAFAA